MNKNIILILLCFLISSCNTKINNMNFLKKLFGKTEQKIEEKREFTDEEYEKDYELKMSGLEYVLGKSHNLVGHAIIPFEIGGAVDMYYFPNGIKGTGFATMELIYPDGSGSIPNEYGTYELLAFTKLDYSEDTAETNPFNLIERRFCSVFTILGNYSKNAKIKPLETCEVPQNEDEPNICVIFDKYEPEGRQFKIGDKTHHLLLVIEVFRDEMEFAMKNGTAKLIEKLKNKGYYPYSDMDRKSVIE